MKSRINLPGYAAALVFLALAAGLASCDRTEEDTSQIATEEPTTTPENTTVVVSPSVSPESPTPTPSPVTFYDLDVFGDATFQYPASWSRDSAGRVNSLDSAEWPSVCRPEGERGLQISALPMEEVLRPKEATDYELGAYSGWELVEENSEDCPGRAHTVVLEREGVSYILIFFSDSAEQEPEFAKILASLELPGGA